jgi:hypothetical protein
LSVLKNAERATRPRRETPSQLERVVEMFDWTKHSAGAILVCVAGGRFARRIVIQFLQQRERSSKKVGGKQPVNSRRLLSSSRQHSSVRPSLRPPLEGVPTPSSESSESVFLSLETCLAHNLIPRTDTFEDGTVG